MKNRGAVGGLVLFFMVIGLAAWAAPQKETVKMMYQFETNIAYRSEQAMATDPRD